MFKEKVRAYRTNVKNPVYCKMLTDNKSGVTYETDIRALGEAMQIQLTAQTASGELFGNGLKVDTEDRLVSIALALDITKIPANAAAEIQGNKIVDGVIIESAEDQAPYIAVGYEIESSGKNREYIWLLKGKAQPINDSVQQRTTSVNYSTQTLNIGFIPREFDKNIKFYADTTHEDFTEAQAEKWFKGAPVTYPTKTARVQGES